MAPTIGIDARELLGATTGVGRYLGELLSRWTARPDAGNRRLKLYTPEPLPEEVSAGAEIRLVPGGRGTSWEQLALRTAVNADAPDVFFAPAYTAPLGLKMPYAVTVHDVSFCAQPEWFRRREGLRRRWLTRRAARMAQRVFTDSQFSRSELEKHFALPAAKIEVIYPGFTPRPHPPTKRERIVLFAGSLFNRRRLPDVIAAFARASRGLPTSRLIIVGEDRTWPPQDLSAVAAAHGVSGRTELRSYISDEELASLYARAAVFVFPFGIRGLRSHAARSARRGDAGHRARHERRARSVRRCGELRRKGGSGRHGRSHRATSRCPCGPGSASGQRSVGPRPIFVGCHGGQNFVFHRGSRSEMTPELSIVIVNFNGGTHLEGTLESLAVHPPAVPCEIVVVDNASTDDSLAAARRRHDVRVMALPRNSGFSAANNVGIGATTGRLVLLLNNDTLVGEGALDALVSKLDADPKAAVAGPRLVDADGRAELSFGPMISPLGELRQKVVVSLHQRGVRGISRQVEAMTRREQVRGLGVRRVPARAAGGG